jgi:acetyl-CoA synthetase
MSAIESVLVENRVFPPSEAIVKAARVSGMESYDALCAEAAQDFEGFWARQAREHLVWTKPFTRTLDESNAPFYKWFDDGELNASANCLDKHMGTPVENKTAIIFEADDGTTLNDLQRTACPREPVRQRAQGPGHPKGRPRHHLHAHDGRRRDSHAGLRPHWRHAQCGVWRLQLPRRCKSASSTRVRWRSSRPTTRCAAAKNCHSRPSWTTGLALGGCDHAAQPCWSTMRTATACNMVAGRDKTLPMKPWQGQSTECAPVAVGAEHPLFILYTSGSTGKPKGVQHSTGGYLMWAKLTMDWTFDIQPSDVFWCTADIGWITGHTYVAYGPLAAGCTQVIFEGIPTYPNAGRFWQMIERHKVTVFYTAPTAIRSLIKAAEADEKVHPDRSDLSSLRILGSVGEPINPEAWMWYYRHVGGERCPIVDTFWQTETGGHVITPLPGATPLVPGSAARCHCRASLAAIVDEVGNDVA